MSLGHDFHLGFIVCEPYEAKTFGVASLHISFDLENTPSKMHNNILFHKHRMQARC